MANDPLTVVTGPLPTSVPGITQWLRGGDTYKWISFTIQADGPVSIDLLGAIGQDADTYKPADSDFVPIQNYITPGVYHVFTLPTLLRWRINSGTNVVIRAIQRTSTPAGNVVNASVPGGSAGTGTGGVVASFVSDLKATKGMTKNQLITVADAVSFGDEGGGNFIWKSGPRPTRDGMMIEYADSDQTGYWKRQTYGRAVSFAVAGLAAAAGTAAIATALALLANSYNFVSIDKLYTNVNDLQVPANFRLVNQRGSNSIAGPTGFTMGLLSNNCLLPQSGTVIEDMYIDGKGAPGRYTGFSTEGLIRLPANPSKSTKVLNTELINCPRHAVYGYQSYGYVLDGLKIRNASSDAIYSQLSDFPRIKNIDIALSYGDGVKVHSKDGAFTTFQLKGGTITDVKVDYSGLDLVNDTLAVELWGGQTAMVNNFRMSRIQVIGPNSITNGTFFGISADTCRGGSCSDFTVDGEDSASVGFGIEMAGCLNWRYFNGTVRRYRYIGATMSQPNTKNCSIESVTFRDALLNGNTYAIQWYDQIKGGDVINCIFKDAGDRYMFFNSAGDGATIQGNKCYVGAQNTAPNCLYVSGSPKNCKILDNTFGPMVWIGDTVTTTGYAKPGEIVGALGWLISRNTFDNLKPDGTAGTNAQLSIYGGGGGHRIESNIGYNYTGPFVGQYDNGPATSFINNFVYNSAQAAQAARAQDTVIINGVVQGGSAVGSYVVLPKQSVTNASLRGIFPDKVVSSVILNDDTNHGFPTTKGMLKTDRTGWELTQYGQLQYDRQTWIPYDGGDLGEYRRHANTDGSWAAWIFFPAPGAITPQVSFALAGVTGGTANNVQAIVGGVARDLHPGMHQLLRSSSALGMLGPDGKYYRAGSEIPGYAGKTAGTRMYLGQLTADGTNNIIEVAPGGNKPDYSVTLPLLEVGYYKDANTRIFLPQYPDEAPDYLGYTSDDMSSYAANAVPGQYNGSQWAAPGEAPKVAADANFATGKALVVYGGSANHMITVPGSVSPDGSILHEFYLTGSGTKSMGLGGRVTGGVGTGNAVTYEVDNSQGQMRLSRWQGGFRTDLKTGAMNLAENVFYWMEFQWRGTMTRGRIWQRGTPVPEWQIVAFDTTVTTAGVPGYMFIDGVVHTGILAWTRGNTPLSKYVNLAN